MTNASYMALYKHQTRDGRQLFVELLLRLLWIILVNDRRDLGKIP
jgi:hypothetical protein